jgi:DNA-binding transcriptional LysR family regulator
MKVSAQDPEEPRWDDVRVFLAAHRHRTLGVAAKKLGFDTSTMSRRLTALEQSLGIRLFDRTREGLTPTRAAEQVLAAAEAMEAAHARLTRDASDVEAAAEGTVRVSVAPGMADHFVTPLLGRLRSRYPRIVIELDGSTRALDLTRHEADLALRSVAPKGAELVVLKLGTGRWVPAGAKALIERLGKLSSWSAAPWIAWDRDMASLGPARWLARYAREAPIALRTSLFTSQLIAAEHGLGLVLAPEPYLHSHALTPVSGMAAELRASSDDLPSDDLWLVGHRALRDVPRVAAVWNFLATEVRRALAP